MLKIIPMNFFISSTLIFSQLFQVDLLRNGREALITLSAYSFVFFTKFSTKFSVKIKLKINRISICRDINLHTSYFSEWKIFDSRRLFTPIIIIVTQSNTSIATIRCLGLWLIIIRCLGERGWSLSGAWGYCCSSKASEASRLPWPPWVLKHLPLAKRTTSKTNSSPYL